ncbi:unnamed protein product [Rodentolepis nana]|uniref:BHLH domain-containing protein n=1 Tax=Rodentolepis nana TaxID=102285 RepID=A0A0R3TXK4_RODNA|nr:unnamed protein product [Rodentolepis nana]
MADGSRRLIKCRPTSFVSRDWQNSRVRFTHNEIERKRRARLKSETDFLHQQLPKAVYRDKLAIFKAGTDLLLHYSNLGGYETRNLILTNNEYSECILESLTDGFGIRIRCEDGVILQATKNWEKCLGSEFAPLIGKTIFDLIVPTELTEQVIRDNLFLSSDDRELVSSGVPVARTFILPLAYKQNASFECQEINHRLLDCCGDIVMSSIDSSPDETEPVLQVICYLLEDRPLNSKASSDGKLFSLRLQPESHLIVEFQGQSLPGGLQSEDILGHSLIDLTLPESRSNTEANLQNAERTGEARFKFRLQNSTEEFLVVTRAITVCDCLHCLVADFYPSQH